MLHHHAIDHVISLKEAADRCGVSIATFRRLLDRGDGPKMTQLSPRRLGFRESHLTEWLDTRLRDEPRDAA